MNNEYCIITTAFYSLEEANKFIKVVLENRLASCCQKSNINSTYWWNDQIQNNNEILIQIKTKKTLYKKVEEKIKQFHSYEVPEILCFDVVDGSKEFLNWIEKEACGE